MIERVIIAIDPADSTGIAAVDAHSCGLLQLLKCDLVKIKAAGFTQQMALDIIEDFIGAREWAVAIEKPFGVRRGGSGRAPTHAERYWRDVVDLLARERCARAGAAYRKPVILRPRPQDWRAPLGLPIKGIGKTFDQRRAWIISKVIERLDRVHHLKIAAPDVAMAVSIAEWAQRVVMHPGLVTKFGGVEMMKWAS